MTKLNRIFRVSIELEDGSQLIVEPPFTIRFTIIRNVQAALNTLEISIFNLGINTRQKVFEDFFSRVDYRRIILEAGYTELTTIFRGNIWSAFTEREGSDILTKITALDGGFDTQTTLTSETLNVGTVKEAIDSLIAQFPNLTRGPVGKADGSLLRPVVLAGNTFELLKLYGQSIGFIVYVDLEEINLLKNDEVVRAQVALINSDSGLLATPQRQTTFLNITMLFEPQIVMSQIIQIESIIQNEFDGQYKVIGVRHQGTISEAIGGDCVTSLDLLVESELFGTFSEV